MLVLGRDREGFTLDLAGLLCGGGSIGEVRREGGGGRGGYDSSLS